MVNFCALKVFSNYIQQQTQLHLVYGIWIFIMFSIRSFTITTCVSLNASSQLPFKNKGPKATVLVLGTRKVRLLQIFVFMTAYKNTTGNNK